MARENPTNDLKVMVLEICPNISQMLRVRTLGGRLQTLALQAKSPVASNVQTSRRGIRTLDVSFPMLKRFNVLNVRTLHRPMPNHPQVWTFERLERTFERSNPAIHLRVSTFERSKELLNVRTQKTQIWCSFDPNLHENEPPCSPNNPQSIHSLNIQDYPIPNSIKPFSNLI